MKRIALLLWKHHSVVLVTAVLLSLLTVGLFLLTIMVPRAVRDINRPAATVVGARVNSVAPSTWDEPQLTNPVTIDLSTAAATQSNDSWALPQTQDYVFTCSKNPVVMPHNLSIWGGHNVVLEGCDLQNTAGGRAVYPHNTGNEFWMHDDNFQSADSNALTEGIDLQEPGTATVVIRDVLIASQAQPLGGSFQTNHADCMQTWSGPRRLLVDGLTCSSQYQGFFLLPNQLDSTTQETIWDFRHVNLHLFGAYAFTFGTNGPQHVDFYTSEIWVDGSGEPRLYQGGEGFEDSQAGTPPGGDYVYSTTTGAAGADNLPVVPAPFPGE